MSNAILEQKFFLGFLAAVSIAFAGVLLPYYGAVFWAVILAIIFAPIQRRLLSRFPGCRNRVALMTVGLCMLLAVVPVILITSLLVQEASDLYLFLKQGDIDYAGYLERFKSVLPDSIERQLDQSGFGSPEAIRDTLSNGVLEASNLLASKVFSFGQGTFQFLVSFFVMVYLLFFCLRDGRALVVRIHRAVPMTHEQKRRLSSKFIRVVRATVKGNIVIALTQGVLGGIIFLILGIPGVVLWSFVMTVLSLLPAVGASLVWGPVVVYFLFSGAILKAVILALYGVLVIGLVDNVLRPLLVGKDTKLPDYVVLISTLGGLAMFGLNGFVIGPLIAALFISAWSLFVALLHDEPEASAS